MKPVSKAAHGSVASGISRGGIERRWPVLRRGKGEGAKGRVNVSLPYIAGQVWDLRTMRRTAELEGAHQMPVRDVDFARGREHLLLSAGDDCRLRFWDLRRAPVRV